MLVEVAPCVGDTPWGVAKALLLAVAVVGLCTLGVWAVVTAQRLIARRREARQRRADAEWLWGREPTLAEAAAGPDGEVARGGSRCEACGAPEVEATGPRTVYACGSSDYDQRPGTFDNKCGRLRA